MRGCVAILLLSTGVPSMIKIAVAPVSTIACDTLLTTLLNLLCDGALNGFCAVAAMADRGTDVMDVAKVPACRGRIAEVVLDVIIVTSSSSVSGRLVFNWVGIGEITNARFFLSATCISAPTCQKPVGI